MFSSYCSKIPSTPGAVPARWNNQEFRGSRTSDQPINSFLRSTGLPAASTLIKACFGTAWNLNQPSAKLLNLGTVSAAAGAPKIRVMSILF